MTMFLALLLISFGVNLVHANEVIINIKNNNILIGMSNVLVATGQIVEHKFIWSPLVDWIYDTAVCTGLK